MADAVSDVAPPPAGAAPVAPAPAPTGAPAPGPASVLGGGGAQTTAAPAPAPAASQTPADPIAAVPEKHRVLGADGKVDVQATLLKVSEAYCHAEKRIGSGDLPPKSADEYAVTVPEALAETIKADELKASEDFKGFLGKMHGLGLTQQQLDGVVGELLTRSAALQASAAPNPEQQAAECIAALAQTWPSPAIRQQQIGLAHKAFQAFAAEGDRDLIDQVGNNPIVVRLLAAVGKELQEDVPIIPGSPEAKSWDDKLAELQAHPGFMDRNHPEHKRLMEAKSALFAQRHGTKKQTLGGGIAISTAR